MAQETSHPIYLQHNSFTDILTLIFTKVLSLFQENPKFLPFYFDF